MEKQIYGNITNTARTQFQFDRIYPNKREMNECRDTDGVYTGRYVLVEYNENPTKNATQLIIKNGKFYYYKTQNVQAIPNVTIAPGKLCFVKDNKEYVFYESQDSEAQPFKKVYSCPFDDTNYNINWNIDYAKDNRGYDSTVWQKVYINNKQEYIMIAELNAKMPNLTMSLDAPGDNLAPHFDEHSNEDNFILHMPAMWDFQVRQAGDGEYSDEKTRHLIKYDSDGNPLEQIQTTELIPAAIFYNKGAFQPYVYEPIEIVSREEEEKYVGGKYYYKVNNVYGLREEENKDSILNFDNLNFYEEITPSDPKKRYYNPEEKETYLNNDPTRLLKTNEEKWHSNQYFYISDYNFTISIEKFDPTIQYFKANINNDKVIYTPVESLTEEEYNNNPNTYYITQEKYSLDTSESFNENIVYFKEVIENGKTSYAPVILQDYNEYEANRYYTFYDKDDEYFIIDHSPTRQPNRTYYEKIGPTEYQEIKFLNKAYISGVYYYQDEEGKYLVDTNDKHTPERQYYTRIKPVVISGEDKIIITPTGSSKRLYNDHNGFLKAANDIQEISINLPSLGAAIATVWDYVYGTERKELIYGSPVYDPKMYDSKGEPVYQTGYNNLNNLISIINQINDLIGHNMIKIDDVNSISIDVDKTIKINNKEMPFDLTTDNAENFIYWIESTNDFYRIKIKRVDGYYAYDLIPMSFMGEKINTINSSLLEIQKVLGTNESIDEASPESIKGALLILQKIITDLSQGIDILAIGESLKSQKEIGYRGYDGTLYERDWSENVFVEASKYNDTIYNDNKYIHNKYLIPYKIIKVTTEINKDNFNNYYSKQIYLERIISSSEDYENLKDNLYIYSLEESQYKLAEGEFNESFTYYEVEPQVPPIYVKLKRYDKNATYYIFEKKNDEITQFPSNESEYKYINVLPGFFTRGANDERIYNDKLNIFEDIVEFYRYVIIHDEPKASFKDNTIYKLEEKNNFSTLNDLYVNKKGHIYSPEEKEFSVLPQAIITNEALLEYLDVPVGTLAYTTTEKKKSVTIIEIKNEDDRIVDENDITVSFSTPGYKGNIDNNTIITLEGSIIKYDIKNNNHRYFAKSGEIKTEAGENIEKIYLTFDKKLKAPVVKKHEKLDTPTIKLQEKLDTLVVKKHEKLDTPAIKLQEKLDVPTIEIKEKLNTPIIEIKEEE